ncbi:MAG: tRNA (adenosine(37)-N6)-dimethylallyltransferase MiaA [Pseudomonadota bacterium]
MGKLSPMDERAILIAGPTASGKSSLALRLAEEAVVKGRQPVIVNADSMQVYRELRVVTARPGEAEEATYRHALYGFASGAETFSTGRWLDEIAAVFRELRDNDLPIIVGGTGLYFKALIEGFATIPPIPDVVRTRLRYELNEHGAAKMHRILRRVDPLAAAEIKAGDGHRILRALEVKEVTDKSILWWQAQAQAAPLLSSRDCRKLIALPERDLLYDRINRRFEMMVGEGALAEVDALVALHLDPALPIMKAIGVPQLAAHLHGDLSLDEAVADAQQESRRYAKRQMTWSRNQMGDDWERVERIS